MRSSEGQWSRCCWACCGGTGTECELRGALHCAGPHGVLCAHQLCLGVNLVRSRSHPMSSFFDL